MNNLLISVIVPVYNAETYLHRCIDSILSQTFTDFELILVDDGSIDGSGKICDEYALLDKRIRVFHKENGGVSSARNLGLCYAKGKWINFVDADDWILEDALLILINKISEDIDVIITETKNNELISGDEFARGLLVYKYSTTLWGKLYRRTIIEDSQALKIPRYIAIGEDWLGNVRIGLIAKKVICLNMCIYMYNYNPNSAMRTQRFSLEYEEIFMKEMENILSNRLEEMRESWFLFRLYALERLITNKVDFSYSIGWISKLLEEKINFHLILKDRIIKSIHNVDFCRLYLLVERLLKNSLAFINKNNKMY